MINIIRCASTETGMITADTTVSDAVTEVAKNPGILKTYFENLMPTVLSGILSVIVAIVLIIIGSRLIDWNVKIMKKSLAKANIEAGLASFISSLTKYALYFLLAMLVLGEFGVTTGSIVAVLGSAGLTVGLALQGSLSNFAGGVLILLLKPFKAGDYIVDHSSGREGSVNEIQICYTKLLTPDNCVVMVPNGTLSNATITNCSRMQKRRIDVMVGISYESSLQKAKKVLTELIDEKSYVLKEEEHLVFVNSLEDSSVQLGVRFWVKSSDYWTSKWDMTESVKLTLDNHNISIPYNQMDIHVVEGNL